MSMHTTIHLNKADIVVVKLALELYLYQLENDERQSTDPNGVALDVLDVKNLIRKVTR